TPPHPPTPLSHQGRGGRTRGYDAPPASAPLPPWWGKGLGDEGEGELMSALAERVAVITGGGGGLGRADALKLAAAGASVVLGDLDLGRAEAAAAEVRAAGGEALAVRVDVTDE